MRVVVICLAVLFAAFPTRADEACQQPYFSADAFRDMEPDQQVLELERLRSGLKQGCSLALKGLSYLNVSIPDDDAELLSWYRLLVETSEILTRQTEVQKDLIEQFLTKIEGLGDDLAAQTKARLAMEENNVALLSERDKAMAEADKLRVGLSALKAEIRVNSMRLVALSTREARLRQERDVIAHKLDEAQKQIAELEEDVVDLHRDVVAGHEKLEASQAAAAAQEQAYDAKVAKLEGQIETLHQKISETTETLAARDAEIAALKETITGQAGVHAKLNDEIDKLLGMVERRNKTIDTLEATIAAHEATIAGRDAEITALGEEIKALGDVIVGKDAEISALSAALAAATKDIQMHEIENAGHLKDKDILANQIAGARVQLDELSAEIIRTQNRNTDLENDFVATVNVLEALRDQHDELLAQHDAIHADVLALQDHRAAFFEQMAELLAGVEGIVVGDDHIGLQTEVLFRSGSAEVNEAGAGHLAVIAEKLRALDLVIPADLRWFVQIDGHTDIQPIRKGSRFRDNWHLSTERALSVLEVLLGLKVSAKRLAAAGYGEFQPVNPESSPEALAQNRRIELRITN